MLERMEPEEGKPSDIFAGGEDAKYAAFLSELVEQTRTRFPCPGR